MKAFSLSLFNLSLFALAAACFSPVAAWATLELRVNYSLLSPSQNISDLCSACARPLNSPSMVNNSGIGADLIFGIPDFFKGLGIGLRYENSGFSTNSNGIDARASNVRTSFLANYRILDQVVFFGPIASYGLSHSGSFEITESGTKIHEYAAKQATSYSIGAEAGFRLVAFTITAEAGYLYEKWSDAESTLNTLSIRDIHFSGTYAKIHLGFLY